MVNSTLRRYLKQVLHLGKPYQSNPVLESWRKVEGDRTLRLRYELAKSSLVFDVGGYHGQWASDIYAMYGCSIHIFEPVMQFASGISDRFAQNPDIKVHHFGLAGVSREEVISVAGDASSMLKTGIVTERISLLSAYDFLEREGITHIDLIKINIEGGEYELLSHLIETNIILIIDNIQVQFHSFVPQAEEKRKDLHMKLSKSHQLTYEYPFVWENWQKL